MSEENTWYISKINNCPLCATGGVFTGMSQLSKRESVGKSINGLKDHLKTCQFKKEGVRVYASININKKENKTNKYISSFETNKVMV